MNKASRISLSRHLMKEGFVASVLLVLLSLFVLWWGTMSVGYVADETPTAATGQDGTASIFLGSTSTDFRR